MWTTAIISGISLGAFYTLIALGFALIYGVTRNFNLAHGELVILAGCVAYWLWNKLALPFLMTFPVAILVLIGVCLTLERLFAHRVGLFVQRPSQRGQFLVEPLDHMEVIQHQVGLGQVRSDRRDVGGPHVGRNGPYRGPGMSKPFPEGR